MRNMYDALVIGGGPGGSTAALLLARAGWSVCLLERKEFPRRKVCGEYLSATNLPLLEKLGVADAFRDRAGPDIRRVGLFAGNRILQANLPRPANGATCWGRALSRDKLDTLLLENAARAGAEVRQPCSAIALGGDSGEYRCDLLDHALGTRDCVPARVIIAAHGSWDPGPLPTQGPRPLARRSDLFGFKAHFRNTALPDDLMPLLTFPGGYGGMVHGDDDRVSLSCCIRRDCLHAIRARWPGEAGAAVLQHLERTCRGVRECLEGAERKGAWLAAGPIRPGIRLRCRPGIFQVGNAAGEAHPVIAEGISMAMQSAWLLTERLLAWKHGDCRGSLEQVGEDYRRAWLRNFGPRLRAAAVVAHWASRPLAVAAVLPILRCFPSLLTWGARISGKDRQLQFAN